MMKARPVPASAHEPLERPVRRDLPSASGAAPDSLHRPLSRPQKPGLAPPLSAELQRALAKAAQLSGTQPVAPDHLLRAAAGDPASAAAAVLEELSLSTKAVDEGLEASAREREEQQRKKELVGVGGRGKGSANKGSVLAKCGVDLTAMSLEGKLDPVLGRDAELDHVMRVLVRAPRPARTAAPPPGRARKEAPAR